MKYLKNAATLLTSNSSYQHQSGLSIEILYIFIALELQNCQGSKSEVQKKYQTAARQKYFLC